MLWGMTIASFSFKKGGVTSQVEASPFSQGAFRFEGRACVSILGMPIKEDTVTEKIQRPCPAVAGVSGGGGGFAQVAMCD